MKYIRTKDGVYEIERYYKPRDYYWVKQDCDQPIDSNEIIKQADTIEELCDEFIHIRKSENLKPMLCYQMHFNLRQIASRVANTNDEIYGAIWNDKGLIYVAKMNDKGELELL